MQASYAYHAGGFGEDAFHQGMSEAGEIHLQVSQ
jgi:hypothetical protein